MLLLDKRNRAHPEDGVAAPGCSKDKKCPAELRAERAVRAYFSLDKTRSLGVAAFFLEILAFPTKDRVTQFCFIAEMLSISTGLLLFFVQTLATFEEGMSRLGLVSSVIATAAVLMYVGVSIMLMMFGGGWSVTLNPKGVRSRRLSRHFLTKITGVGVLGELHEKNRFLKGAYIFDTFLSPSRPR